MSHQVLSSRQFSGMADTQEEKSVDSPDPENVIPEKEDQQIGEKPN
jgi:hypothetical protein